MWTSFIGFMGSGKSTLTLHLQRATGRPAVDLDCTVAESAGASVARIFDTRGEKAFRCLEAAALTDLRSDRDLFLAVGGGCVETSANVAVLRRGGVVIWLDAPWQILRARIEQGALSERPLFEQLGWEGLQRLHRRRRRLYAAAADFRLRSDRQQIAVTGRNALLKSLLWRRRQWGQVR